MKPHKLLQTYLDRLAMFVVVDAADRTFTASAGAKLTSELPRGAAIQ